MRSKALSFSALAVTTALVGCGGDNDTQESVANPDGRSDQSSYTSLDATQGKAYLDLSSGHSVTENEAWHFAYQKYVGFSVNSGVSGEGSVAVCIAHTPDGIFDDEGAPIQAEFEKLTRDNTLTDFEAVNLASCEEADFKEDSLKTVIELDNWTDYDFMTHTLSLDTSVSNGWIVRSATKNDAQAHEYARVKVASLDYTSGTNYDITFNVETWDANGQVFNAVQVSPVLDFTSGRVYWDLETNTVVTANDDWELSIVINGFSWDIQVNSGVSGAGSAGIATLNVDDASLVTDPTSIGYSADEQILTYTGDSADSVMGGPGSYGALSYGVAGGHGMWPNFTTYLFKDGDRYFKAQVVSNTGEDGTLTSGNLYVRYAEVVE